MCVKNVAILPLLGLSRRRSLSFGARLYGSHMDFLDIYEGISHASFSRICADTTGEVRVHIYMKNKVQFLCQQSPCTV